MTEDEAKEKWCPFVRVVHYSIHGNNAWATNQGFSSDSDDELLPTHCIGSKCMAWRWQYDSEYQVFTDNNDNRFEANTVGRLNEAKENNYKPFIPEHGYCGLAGQP